MAYTTIDDPSAYFQTKIYTGNGSSSHAITFDGNSDLQPDWTWIKSRSNDTDHILTDIVRGVGVGIKSNTTAGNANDSNQVVEVMYLGIGSLEHHLPMMQVQQE